mmetsp:Transcript_43323/g.114020  ORF Transcript_43323/g.114020 Transcript_43323/m.114020 type:complete len:396 (+) Transcript_43323:1347-2534(+)
MYKLFHHRRLDISDSDLRRLRQPFRLLQARGTFSLSQDLHPHPWSLGLSDFVNPFFSFLGLFSELCQHLVHGDKLLVFPNFGLELLKSLLRLTASSLQCACGRANGSLANRLSKLVETVMNLHGGLLCRPELCLRPTHCEQKSKLRHVRFYGLQFGRKIILGLLCFHRCFFYAHTFAFVQLLLGCDQSSTKWRDGSEHGLLLIRRQLSCQTNLRVHTLPSCSNCILTLFNSIRADTSDKNSLHHLLCSHDGIQHACHRGICAGTSWCLFLVDLSEFSLDTCQFLLHLMTNTRHTRCQRLLHVTFHEVVRQNLLGLSDSKQTILEQILHNLSALVVDGLCQHLGRAESVLGIHLHLFNIERGHHTYVDVICVSLLRAFGLYLGGPLLVSWQLARWT